ncbi:MAG: trypsin-like peptidase domain-containing protein, partial [Cephaloticoccus sp.]|nr:trypsin-like peptidase domain-containing protein [Cephaloticoccus sp.]
PIADAGSLKMSYADVAETILPSVVTIFPSTPMNAQGDMEIPDMEDLPPQLRPFFRRFFDQQENNDEEGSPAPRRRMPHGEMPRMRGVGSGVIVTEDGYILTNNHVVQDSDDIEVAVESNGTKRSYKATVIGTDPETDVAMIKIDAKGLVPATIGDSSSLRVGDVVLAAGAPMEMNLSITQGIVSALGRSNLHVTNYADFIQTD